MSQHFLLSAQARTLSLAGIMRMSDEEAHAAFVLTRFAENGGKPFCYACGCVNVYAYTTRQIWKCVGCGKQFSVTSGTIFASRKLPIRDYLAAIAIFVNAVKGLSPPSNSGATSTYNIRQRSSWLIRSGKQSVPAGMR